ncbi:transposase [Chloroflexota bacterium]
MSQENKDKADSAEDRTKKTRGFMQQVRTASRRKYTPEEKVRIVLEGFRREVAVNELCRQEGIPHQDHTTPPDVGYRRFLLPGSRLGLLLPSDCNG